MSFNRFRGRRRPASPQASANRSPAQPQSLAPREAPRAPTPPPPPTPEQLAAIAASPFTALGVSSAIVRGILDEGYTTPTPVQNEVIPPALAQRDVLACAQTGTGKTAGFVVPILQQLAALPPGPRAIRVLILSPTRELAAQIAERVEVYGRYLNLRHTVVYGGVSQLRQEHALRDVPDVLVATPGRLLDLMRQGHAKLDTITHYVLDEADRMLDMGFVRDVQRITAALPAKRQTLLFSATMPAAIEAFARTLLTDPVRVAVTPAVTTAQTVDQSVVFVAKADKRAMLERVLLDKAVVRAIVFTRTKHGANRLSQQLEASGIGSAAIHGNKSQNARERALEAFRAGTTRVLVATDVAARGIDVDGISHVINYDLPDVAESYVHRIGRAGRAGATGSAISFCDHEERPLLADIERLIKKRLPVLGGGERPSEPQNASSGQRPAGGQGQRQGGGQQHGGQRHGGQGQRHGGQQPRHPGHGAHAAQPPRHGAQPPRPGATPPARGAAPTPPPHDPRRAGPPGRQGTV